MKKLLILFVSISTVLHLHAQYSWQSLPPFAGPGRHHAIAFSHGGKAYVTTGLGTTLLKDVWEYDTLTQTWTQLPDYPGPTRAYGIGAVINDTAYIGLGYTGTTDLTDWWAYDFSTSTWTQKNNIPMAPRRHPTAVALNGKLYMGMGDNANFTQFRDWWEYDPTNDSWTQKSNYPGLTMHHPVCTTDGNLIYLSEGHLVQGATNTGSTDFYSYDPVTDTWTTLADMPGPGVVAGASFALPNGKIYSGDGITEPVETWHNEFYEYDIATGIWDTIPNYPGVGNFGPSYFNLGNGGYVVTGSNGATGTTEFFRYAPMLALDASITGILPGIGCGTVSATVTLTNNGTSTITSCLINYKVDNNTVQTITWNGNLASGASTPVVIAAQSVSSGTHTFTCYTSSPNSLSDMNTFNDQMVRSFVIFPTTSVNIPITESFASVTFPPSGWSLDNPDGMMTWERNTTTGGFGNSSQSAYIDLYNYGSRGENDILYGPPIDLSSVSSAQLTFSVAHARYDLNYCDELDIEVSTDCGGSWTNVYSKDCSSLPTANPTTNAFVPTSTQWRTDSVSLNAFTGNNAVVVRFRSVNDYGNRIYIDDINIDASSGIVVPGAVDAFQLYPNPANSVITIAGTNGSDIMRYTITNSLGEEMATSEFNGGNSYELRINVSQLPKGVYFISIADGHAVSVQKLIIE